MTLTGTRVLVVEDEMIVAMMIEQLLQELGCEVVAVAGRLKVAKEKASTLAVDVVTLDINLAGEFSYPVAEILVSRAIPFVFATGHGAAGVPSELKRFPVVAKPFSIGQLASGLRSAMATA